MVFKLQSVLNDLGYNQLETEETIFFKNFNQNETNTIVYILVYVDDLIYFGKDDNIIDYATEELIRISKGSDKGEVSCYLRVSVCRTETGLKLSQTALLMHY